MSVTKIAHEYERRYGPYAFGVLSLLIVWIAIVGPALDRARIDTAALKEISDDQTRRMVAVTEQQGQITQAQRATADVLNSATIRLDKITERLERTADRLNTR
jgi:hypothetical protein